MRAGAPMTVLVPLRTRSAPNLREHWASRARRVRDERRIVAWCLQSPGRRVPPQERRLPCVVTLTRIAPRALDDDNLRGALKATRDEVAAWLLVDDRDPRVTWTYAERRGAVREYAVEVSVAWPEVAP